MIKAKITVFDDETGQVYEKDRVIEPYRTETGLDEVLGGYVTHHEFKFEIHKLDFPHICLNCKHFSCNKPTSYADDRILECCTLHPNKEDAYGYCDDYEKC